MTLKGNFQYINDPKKWEIGDIDIDIDKALSDSLRTFLSESFEALFGDLYITDGDVSDDDIELRAYLDTEEDVFISVSLRKAMSMFLEYEGHEKETCATAVKALRKIADEIEQSNAD